MNGDPKTGGGYDEMFTRPVVDFRLGETWYPFVGIRHSISGPALIGLRNDGGYYLALGSQVNELRVSEGLA